MVAPGTGLSEVWCGVRFRYSAASPSLLERSYPEQQRIGKV